MEEAFDDSGGSVHRTMMALLTLLLAVSQPAASSPLSPYSMPSLVAGSASSSSGGVGGGDGRLILENRHLHSPCNFNPRCLCSSGGGICIGFYLLGPSCDGCASPSLC